MMALCCSLFFNTNKTPKQWNLRHYQHWSLLFFWYNVGVTAIDLFQCMSGLTDTEPLFLWYMEGVTDIEQFLFDIWGCRGHWRVFEIWEASRTLSIFIVFFFEFLICLNDIWQASRTLFFCSGGDAHFSLLIYDRRQRHCFLYMRGVTDIDILFFTVCLFVCYMTSTTDISFFIYERRHGH